jgi:hypothetical protein
MSDSPGEARLPIPLDDRHDAAMRAFAIALERRYPGITAEAHEILVEQVALDDIIRLHGRRTARTLMQANAEAERWTGALAVIAPKHARWEARLARRKRRGK